MRRGTTNSGNNLQRLKNRVICSPPYQFNLALSGWLQRWAMYIGRRSESRLSCFYQSMVGIINSRHLAWSELSHHNSVILIQWRSRKWGKKQNGCSARSAHLLCLIWLICAQPPTLFVLLVLQNFKTPILSLCLASRAKKLLDMADTTAAVPLSQVSDIEIRRFAPFDSPLCISLNWLPTL